MPGTEVEMDTHKWESVPADPPPGGDDSPVGKAGSQQTLREF